MELVDAYIGVVSAPETETSETESQYEPSLVQGNASLLGEPGGPKESVGGTVMVLAALIAVIGAKILFQV